MNFIKTEHEYMREAIENLSPGVSFLIRGDALYSNIEVLNGGDIAEESAIQLEMTRLQAEYDAKEYQRLRQPEYPPLTDLADALYWQSQGDETKMTAYLEAVEAVKNKYPKGVA